MLTDTLLKNGLRTSLVHHPFFGFVRRADLTRDGVAFVLGQWWHPLHYFPSFLARTVSVVPGLDMKTSISTILFQELGEGDPSQAHERIYVETMTAVGFGDEEVTGARPTEATQRLVSGYATASSQALSALGFVYGTEVADLAMVAGIGRAVRRLAGVRSLPWVDIHVRQEPQHVKEAAVAVEFSATPDDTAAIVSHAEHMWRLWIAFFDEVLAGANAARGQGRLFAEPAPARM